MKFLIDPYMREQMENNNPELKFKCPGIEFAHPETEFHGCCALENGLIDCPVCEGKGYIINCPVCGEPVKWDSTCKQGCWYPLEDCEPRNTNESNSSI